MDDDCRISPESLSTVCYKVLELYSGIGGVHCAFHVARIPHDIVGAADVNTAVNEIYRFNFKKIPILQRNIISFTAKDIEALCPDIITMCPPCQPFTRVGLKQESGDPRSESFMHIIDVIAGLQRKPSYLFMENVKGFETSDVRNILISMLEKSGYMYQEFLLTPSQLGIPNSRLRYYMLAKLKPLNFSFKVTEMIQTMLPSTVVDWKFQMFTVKEDQCPLDSQKIAPLHHFLESRTSAYFENFLLPDKILLRYASVLDIVDRNHCNSCCFTKAYGHYVQGTGSVLHTNEESVVADIYEKISKIPDEMQRLGMLKELKLCYFTPKEVANIMCFPDTFCFPSHIKSKQKYRALGNSINVFVVSRLLQLLIS